MSVSVIILQHSCQPATITLSGVSTNIHVENGDVRNFLLSTDGAILLKGVAQKKVTDDEPSS